MPVATSTSSEPIISSFESQASLGVMMTDQGPLPLKSVAIDAHIDQLFAGVKVRQGYVNTHQEAIEASYIFPLPDRAAVTRFQAKLSDRLIEGILKERGEARQEYDEAIQKGHRAAIAEEERPNVFTMRVGNILPGESADVELTLCMPLAYEEGEATLRFPLVVAPRYIPGTPLPDAVGLGTSPDTDAVPDASRITPPILLAGYPYPVQLDIAVSLSKEITQPQANMPVKSVATEGTHTRWQVQPGQKLDRDFLFRFQVAAETITSQVMMAPDLDDPTRGTLSITVVPPKPSAKLSKPKPRRIVFVLDRSGSMAGWKLVAARRALGRMIDTISPQDHFAIFAFDNQIEQYPSPMQNQNWYAGTDVQRFRAIEALAGITARGGTEMMQPLSAAAKVLNDISPEEDRILVLLTDGQVGNEDQMLKALAPLFNGMRIFTLGIDRAVNEAFLRRLAQLGGGSMEVVESEERLDAVMQRIHRRIAAPVLRDLAWKADGIMIGEITVVPERVPDLFAEAPVVIQGRCLVPEKGTITLTATDENGQPWKQTLPCIVQASRVLAPCWARTKLRQLEDRYASGQMSVALSKEIVNLSLQHRVLSRFTAYVAVDRSAVVNPDGQPREIVQAVEMPAGWHTQINQVFAFASTRGSQAMACSIQPLVKMKRSLKVERAHEFTIDECDIPLSAQVLTLSSYRVRAGQLAKDTRALLSTDPNAAWGKFELRLRELLDDLNSVQAQDADLTQVLMLFVQMKMAGANNDLLRNELLEALERFAGNHKPAEEPAAPPPAPPKKRRRLPFWK